jgi:hypothetical protein
MEKEDGFSPFKPSKKLLSSGSCPIANERGAVDVGDDSEGGKLSSGVSEYSTPIVGRRDKGGRCLVRRAMERNIERNIGRGH